MGMDSKSYVVRLCGSEEAHPYKYFGSRQDAVAHAGRCVQAGEAERADVFATGAIDPRAAIAALRSGEAELVQSVTPHASQAEIEAAAKRGWEEAQRQGADAMLKYLGL